MRIARYTSEFQDGKWTHGPMQYGMGTANLLLYLLEPFRENWTLIGLIHSDEEYLGVKIEEYSLVSVFGNRDAPKCHSDEINREQSQIDAGKTAIVLFYGTDNSSYMRRMTPEEYDKLELIRYTQHKDDLFYNS